jgi:hypothetical protein
MAGEKCKECVAIYNSGTAWNNGEELWDGPDSARCRFMFRRLVASALDPLHHVVGLVTRKHCYQQRMCESTMM